MRIVHFDADALGTPYGGGQARRTFEVARRLAIRHDVTVVTAGYPGLRGGEIDGVRYVRMASLSHPLNFAWYFVELLPRALAARADLLVEDFSFPLTASGLPAFTRTPVVGIASYFFAAQFAAKIRLPIDAWERVAMRPYRTIVALTQPQAEQLRRRAPRADVRIIGNAADGAAFAHAWTGAGRYVAFLGRLVREMKGLDLLLDACALLPPGLAVRIAGDGPDAAWLAGEIRRRDAHNVEVIGRLDGDDRHRFFADAAVLAFPSRWENQSLVALDALAIGLPAVAFDTASSRATFGEAALFAPAFDAAAFAAAVSSVATDARRARELSALARSRAGGRTWDDVAAAQERLYLDVLSRRSAAD